MTLSLGVRRASGQWLAAFPLHPAVIVVIRMCVKAGDRPATNVQGACLVPLEAALWIGRVASSQGPHGLLISCVADPPSSVVCVIISDFVHGNMIY